MFFDYIGLINSLLCKKHKNFLTSPNTRLAGYSPHNFDPHIILTQTTQSIVMNVLNLIVAI